MKHFGQIHLGIWGPGDPLAKGFPLPAAVRPVSTGASGLGPRVGLARRACRFSFLLQWSRFQIQTQLVQAPVGFNLISWRKDATFSRAEKPCLGATKDHQPQ